jgi:sugar phosphate permease
MGMSAHAGGTAGNTGQVTGEWVGPRTAQRADEYHPDPHRWRILGVTLVVGFMSLLDVTIVNVALPSMRAGLHTSAGTIQWVVSGYALAFGLTLVAGGRLGDAYGRRRLMVIGLVGFVLSSAAVGLARPPSWSSSRGWCRARQPAC